MPDNAFQLVDDEPQDLPTEAEVDAMLAATASALLTSGLASEPDLADEPTIDHGAGYIESPDDDLPLKPLAPMTTAIAQLVATAVVFHRPAEPAPGCRRQPLSPRFDEPEPEEELTFACPQGTPLFSEEAILAAAAPAPEAPTEPEVPIEAVEATAPVAASIEDAETVVPVPSVRDDLSAHVAVWSVALMEWSTGSRASTSLPKHVGSPPPSVPESGPPVSNV